MEENREWVYDAFISYRHAEPDAFVAGAIHKYLESYKLPGNLKKDKASKGEKLKREKIHKVFRDAEELPLTSNLNDTIMEALANSEFLIVICSPRLKESIWCRKEIETFIEKRGVENVFAVLVEGEPSESFPEELLYRDIKTIGPDGTEQIIREPMEPLAANARGENNRERMKLLKTEALRLMAPMFGCTFDDLKQRHREQKMKRTIRIISTVAAVSLAFAAVSTGLALRIKRQNIKISEQNEQISSQAEQIEEQYKEALVNNAIANGQLAENMLNDGDRLGSISKLMELYPNENNGYPYIKNNEYVLSDALWLYEIGNRYRPSACVAAQTVISFSAFSPEGTKVAAMDAACNVYVWDAKTGEELFMTSLETNDYFSGDPFYMPDEDTIILADANNIVAFDINTSEKKYTVDIPKAIAIDGRSDIFFAYTYEELALIDAKDGSIKKNYNFTEGDIALGMDDYAGLYICDPLVELYESSEYYAFFISSALEYKGKMFVINIADGDIVREYAAESEAVGKGEIYGNMMYVVGNEQYNSGDAFYHYTADVCAYDLDSDSTEPVWVYTNPDGYIYQIEKSLNGASQTIAFTSYSEVILLDGETGARISSYDCGGSIVFLAGYAESDMYCAINDKGEWGLIIPGQPEAILSDVFESASTYVAQFDISNGRVVTSDGRSNDIILYEVADSENYDILTDDAVDAIFNMHFSEDHSQIYACSYEYTHTIDSATNTYVSHEAYDTEKWAGIDNEEKEAILTGLGIDSKYVSDVVREDSGRYIAVEYRNYTVEFYKVDSNGKPDKTSVSTINSEIGNLFDGFSVSEDGTMMAIYNGRGAYVLDLRNADDSIKMPEDSDVVAYIRNAKLIDFERNKVYMVKSTDVYILPFYEREELGDIAGKYL